MFRGYHRVGGHFGRTDVPRKAKVTASAEGGRARGFLGVVGFGF